MKHLKLIVIFSSIIFLTINSYSQKLEKERLAFYNYTQLPSEPLPFDYKSYICDISSISPEYNMYFYTNFKLTGFEKKQVGTSDFKIIIEEFPFSIVRKEHKTGNTTSFKDGKKITKKAHYFHYLFSYKIQASIIDKTGKNIKNIIADVDKGGLTHREVNYADAEKEIKLILDNYKKNRKEMAITKLSTIFEDQFGYPTKMKRLQIFKVKAKKQNYDDFDEAYNLAMKAIEIVKKDENDIKNCFNAYEPAINKWKKALEESDIENKKARINKNITIATYYNLGCAYLVCKKYDKAIENFGQAHEITLKLGKYKINTLAKKLKDHSIDMKERAEANKK